MRSLERRKESDGSKKRLRMSTRESKRRRKMMQLLCNKLILTSCKLIRKQVSRKYRTHQRRSLPLSRVLQCLQIIEAHPYKIHS